MKLHLFSVSLSGRFRGLLQWTPSKATEGSLGQFRRDDSTRHEIRGIMISCFSALEISKHPLPICCLLKRKQIWWLCFAPPCCRHQACSYGFNDESSWIHLIDKSWLRHFITRFALFFCIFLDQWACESVMCLCFVHEVVLVWVTGSCLGD